jgi:hypothetical protein
MDPIPSNVVSEQEGLQAVFHGDTMSPSGQYTFIPEPATLSLLALGGLAMLRKRK